jgi:hypothetical protein
VTRVANFAYYAFQKTLRNVPYQIFANDNLGARVGDGSLGEPVTKSSVSLAQPRGGEKIKAVPLYPAVQQRRQASRTPANHKITRSSDMDDQPVWDRVIKAVDADRQISRPFSSMNHSRYLEIAILAALYGNHRSIESGGRRDSSDFLFDKTSRSRESKQAKSDSGETVTVYLFDSEKGNPALHRPALFPEQTCLVSYAENGAKRIR